MRYKVFVLTILASVSFFNYHGMVSSQLAKAMFYAMIIISLVVAYVDGVSIRDTKYPRVPYFVMLACIVFSAIMASLFHPQSIVSSVVTTMPYVMAYLFFFIMLKLDLPRERIMNTYIVLCCISAAVYFCNVLTMPNNIFGEPIIYQDMTRGVIRIPVVFIEFLPMLVFYGINKLLLSNEKKLKWIALIILASLLIFMAVIRQIIALTAVLGLWFFFRKVSLRTKVMIIVAALAVVVLVLPQIPIYKTMIELSEDQVEKGSVEEEDIRIQAWRHYTYENQTNALTPILGNGVPSYGGSLWGKMSESDNETSGKYAEDVGWAGFFWYFGGIATVCLLTLLIMALFKHKEPENQYLNYWLIFVTITSVASAPILYYWQILDICVCLAMVYKVTADQTKEKAIKPETEDAANHSSDNIKLQQYPRYPQLH